MISFGDNGGDNVGNDGDLIPDDPLDYKRIKRTEAFQKEITNITAIMTRREKVAQMAGRFVHYTNGAVGVCDIGLACFYPHIGLPLLGANVAVHFVNGFILKKSNENFEHGHWALDTLGKPDIVDQDTNQKACKALHSTERYIRNFEKGRSITSTIIKWGLGRVGSAAEAIAGAIVSKAIEIALLFDETYEGIAKNVSSEKEIPSSGMRHGIHSIEEKLAIPHPVPKPFLPEKVTKFLPEKLARVVIRPSG